MSMRLLLFLILLLSLASCAQTGYQGSYIISHTEEEEAEVTAP
jgi:hypothetical protein